MKSDAKLTPLVSVIINTRNGANYLIEAITSVVDQTYHNWELVIYDNNSTDSTEAIVKTFTDRRIQYIKSHVMLELGEARNRAVSYARGEWLNFLDSDDYFDKQKLEVQVRSVSHPDVGIIYCDCTITAGNGLLERQKRVSSAVSWLFALDRRKSGWIFKTLLTHNYIFLVSALIRRTAFNEVGGFNPELEQAEDYDLFLKISEKYESIFVDNALCTYRIHSHNLTNGREERAYREIQEILSLYKKYDACRIAMTTHDIAFGMALFRNGKRMSGLSKIIFNNWKFPIIRYMIFKFFRYHGYGQTEK